MLDRSAKLTAKGVVIEYWLGRSRTIFTAVDGVDLVVRPGEFLAIVGPSGCGKTTFLNAVDGLQPISAVVGVRGAGAVAAGHAGSRPRLL